ncbi:hypothetical protein ABIE26_003277 [Pedobacter africanus]|uniref:Uncharacterized protein n=1 Tax=Pedobacter africanus TaxID=151894 RepID=A0ACC6KZH9_9SPHI|nr:PKD-like family lipoprotein [Pedobacter africanus]MDR6784631.1 hypothetical protein [Pedobacter africanus]
MKRSLNYYILSLLSIVVVSSCSKDLGNYEYNTINELNIKGVKSDYVVKTGIDTLRIKPDIAASLDQADANRYTYFWVLKTGTLAFDTIGRNKDLEYAVRVNPSTYDLFYRVLDKQTGVTWTANTKITVSTGFSRGLLIMGEDEQGYAEAEMLSMITDTVYIPHILSTSGLPRLREPVSLLHTGGNDRETKLWAFTKTGSYYLDRATMTGTVTNNFSRVLYISEPINPETLHPIALAPQIRTAAGAVGSTFYRAMLTVGGDVFAASPFLTGGDFFNNPVNRVAPNLETRLPAAPYLLYPIGSMSSFMWYDTQNQRFLMFTNFAGNVSSVLADAPNAIFPWNQPAGRSLVYAENTRNTDGGSTQGNSFAIMKDADNTHHIYKFYANGTNPAKRNYYMVKPIATDFAKADHYAFSSKRTVVFYSVGNKLYAYDYNPGNERSYTISNIGNDVVTMIKFDTQIDHLTNSLYVATYNSASKGTLRRFMVGSDPNTVELLLQGNSTWSGLVKIKDINWRAVN